jgi:hypothetical protein
MKGLGGLRLWFFLAALIGTLLIGNASAAVALYRTDTQAQRYLMKGLKTWAGIDLTRARFKSAFCINGFYSRYEKAHPQRFDQNRTNRYGEHVFRSFACSLSVGNRTFDLYLRSRPAGKWLVRADRP